MCALWGATTVTPTTALPDVDYTIGDQLVATLFSPTFSTVEVCWAYKSAVNK